MDPCELRQAKGDEAVRALVENRSPLFAFAITTHPEAVQPGHRGGPGRGHQRHHPAGRQDQGGDPAGRVHPAARRLARPELAPIRGRVREFDAAAAREAKRAAGRSRRRQRSRPTAGRAGRIGPDDGRPPADRPTGAPPRAAAPAQRRRRREPPDPTTSRRTISSIAGGPAGRRPRSRRPNPGDQATSVEREALKLALQQPDLVAGGYDQVRAEAFTNPAYAALHGAVEAAGGPPADGSKAAWVDDRRRPPAGRPAPLAGQRAGGRATAGTAADSVNASYAGAILARMAERVAAGRRAQAALRPAAGRGRRRVRAGAASCTPTWSPCANYRRALADRAEGT